ncbi:MAG: glycoside hydrolase family 5 protein [Acidimicrobiales bacterium]
MNPGPRPPSGCPGRADAMAGWRDGHWRGANLFQRRVGAYDTDPRLIAGGAVVPRYTTVDLEALAATGANMVVLSHPGVYTEVPPYRLDPAVTENLIDLLDQVDRAGLRAVVAMRTGPGRSEITFVRGDVGRYYAPADLIETVWTDPVAQDAWVAMWTYLASTLGGHPAIVGYDLMVEPNASVVVGPDDPAAFLARHRGDVADWGGFQARLAAAVRAVDHRTPILVEPDGWATPAWMPLLPKPSIPDTVDVVHLYTPYDYTNTPGGAGSDRAVDRFAGALRSAIEASADRGVPLAVLELGVTGDRPDGEDYLHGVLRHLERAGVSWAMWMWGPAASPGWTQDPLALTALSGRDDPRLAVCRAHWSGPTARPATQPAPREGGS